MTVTRQGFSLVEVMIAICIMGILSVVATLNYNTMKTKANIEKQTRELNAAIIGTRLSAMQNRQRKAIFLGANQYILRSYSSLNDIVGTLNYSVNLKYAIQKKDDSATTPSFSAPVITSDKIEFDTNGFTPNIMTLAVTPITYNQGQNCIVTHFYRTNIGRMSSATNCSAQ
jgi:prepilin-type N-terminal cleavage/methylation domain-containing protein